MILYSDMSKQWKESPPGPEQLALESMFENDSIEEYDTPGTVQRRTPMFQPFSERVFSTHFRKTKAKLGGYGNCIITIPRTKKFFLFFIFQRELVSHLCKIMTPKQYLDWGRLERSLLHHLHDRERNRWRHQI